MCLVFSALLQRSRASAPHGNLQSEAGRPPSDAELDAIINRSSSRAAAAAAAEARQKGGAGAGAGNAWRRGGGKGLRCCFHP